MSVEHLAGTPLPKSCIPWGGPLLRTRFDLTCTHSANNTPKRTGIESVRCNKTPHSWQAGPTAAHQLQACWQQQMHRLVWGLGRVGTRPPTATFVIKTRSIVSSSQSPLPFPVIAYSIVAVVSSVYHHDYAEIVPLARRQDQHHRNPDSGISASTRCIRLPMVRMWRTA